MKLAGTGPATGQHNHSSTVSRASVAPEARPERAHRRVALLAQRPEQGAENLVGALVGHGGVGRGGVGGDVLHHGHVVHWFGIAFEHRDRGLERGQDVGGRGQCGVLGVALGHELRAELRE